MTYRNPWPGFLKQYAYSLLRSLVTHRGSMTAKEYLRAERLFNRFAEAKERELKRAVLLDVVERWNRVKHLGVPLQAALQEALDDVQEPRKLVTASGTYPANRGRLDELEENQAPYSDIPGSGIRSKQQSGIRTKYNRRVV